MSIVSTNIMVRANRWQEGEQKPGVDLWRYLMRVMFYHRLIETEQVSEQREVSEGRARQGGLEVRTWHPDSSQRSHHQPSWAMTRDRCQTHQWFAMMPASVYTENVGAWFKDLALLTPGDSSLDEGLRTLLQKMYAAELRAIRARWEQHVLQNSWNLVPQSDAVMAEAEERREQILLSCRCCP
eukprot:3397320-Amphidinium_carterae.2